MGLEKGIDFKVTYKSDMAGLRKDLTRLKKIKTGLANRPLLIPVKLDTSGIAADVLKIQNQLKAGMIANSGAAASSGTTASGLHLPQSTARAQAKAIRTIEKINDLGELTSTTQDFFDGRGKKRRVKTTHTEDGDITETLKTSNQELAKFDEALQSLEQKHRGKLSKAVAAKDTAAEMDILQKKAGEMENLLQGPAQSKTQRSKDGPFAHLTNEPEFAKAKQNLDKLNQKLNTLGASKSQQRSVGHIENAIRKNKEKLKDELTSNKTKTEAAKLTSDIATREKKVNALLNERNKILERRKAMFNRLDKTALGRGLPSTANRAHTGARSTQSDIDKLTNTRHSSATKAVREDEKLGLDNAIRNAKRKAAIALEENSALQRQTKLRLEGKRQEKEISRILQERVNIRKRLEQSLTATMATANKKGQKSVAVTASGAIHNNARSGVKELNQLAEAQRKSGHSTDFHTGSLLKNAATFVRWSLAMQAVMAPLRALQAGIASMIEVDRQFATLRAVFRGTDTEVQKLKEDTLELAIAQGQSSKTAMDAAIRWSRFGLTRIQVLQQVETALVGANVAEMSAADTSERLAAIYSAWNLELSETASLLDSLNAISNRYNATNKGMLNGIVAGGAVAKQAGLELQEYAALLSVGESAGFTGKEIGTTTKFVFQRIRRPEKIKKLNEELGIDLTKPSGEIKNMSVILKELADIYPTLNKFQQNMLLNITAGGRQAGRFATLLEGQREAQIRSAEAGLDTSSALRENEKILESMEAKINSLKSAWTELWVAFGDTGALKGVANLLQQVADGISTSVEMAQNIGNNKPTEKNIRLTTRHSRSAFGSHTMGGRVSENELIEQIANHKKRLADRKENNREYLGDARFATSNSSLEEELADLQTILENHNLNRVVGSITNAGKAINDLRKETLALKQGETVFNDLASAIEKGIEPPKKLTKEWRIAARLLLSLDDGTQKFSDNYAKISRQIANGNNGAASKGVRSLADEFAPASTGREEKFLKEQSKQYKQASKDLSEIKAKRDKIASRDTFGDEDLGKKMAELKSVNGQYDTALRSLEDIGRALQTVKEKSALDPNQSSGLKQYLQDTLTTIETVKNSLDSLSIQGTESPQRVFNRKNETLGLKLQSLKKTRSKTLAEGASAFIERDALKISIDKRKKELAHDEKSSTTSEALRQKSKEWITDNEKILTLKSEAVEADKARITIIDIEIRKQEEKMNLARTQLEIEKEATRLKEAFDKGSQDAAINARRFLIGTNDSQKKISQSNALIELSKEPLDIDPQSGVDILNKRAALLQNEAIIANNILSIRQREADITATLASTQERIKAAQEKQTEEVSKRLAMAGREDQLRAAMAAAATKDQTIGLDEFSFLSQNTRQAFKNYAPENVKGLGNATENTTKENKKLFIEKKHIQDALDGLVPGLRGMREQIDYFVKDNPLNANNLGIKGKSLQNIFGSQKPADVIINAGAIHIDVTEQFTRFTENITDIIKQDLNQQMETISQKVEALSNASGGGSAFDFTQ